MKTNKTYSLSPIGIAKLKAELDRQRKKEDPIYASARPWDWKICRHCQMLVPRGEAHCAACGGRQFNGSPMDVFRIGLSVYGIPPSSFD